MSQKSRIINVEDGRVDFAKAFWDWFVQHEAVFRQSGNDTETNLNFVEELVNKMKLFNPWLKALAGPFDKNKEKFELIITADGEISLFCKVEELVQKAPDIPHWIITAHKPPLGFEEIKLEVHGRNFNASNTHFYPVVYEEYPDEVNIMLTREDFNEEEDIRFQNAGMIFLENGLGEINVSTRIDHYETGPEPAPGSNIEIIPITKLPDYLNWREKEFVEKYGNGLAAKPEDDFHLLEAEDKDGNPLLLLLDAGFKDWTAKQSYPWLVLIEVYFGNDAPRGKSGLPPEELLLETEELENEIIDFIPADGTVYYIGHKIYDNTRTIYFYAQDYKQMSILLHHFLESREFKYETSFFIRKDKYWREVGHFFKLMDQL